MTNALATHEIDRELDRIDTLATKMDALIRLPGTRITLGLDALLGLVPVVGDTLVLAPAGYILMRGYQMTGSKRLLARMTLNAGLDYLIGLIPVIGDLFDIGWKGNLRNARLLRAHLGRPQEVPMETGLEY